MPFRSEKQRRYLWAKHPEIARRWTAEYGSKTMKKRKKMKRQIGTMVDAFSMSTLDAAVDGFAMAFDESKHPRGKKGTHEGGKFVKGDGRGKLYTHYDSEGKPRKMTVPSITKHPMFTQSDYEYLKGKGYTDDEIETLWDRDRAAGKSPLHHKKPPVDLVKYLNNQPQDDGTSMSMILSLSRDEAEFSATDDPLTFWKEVAHAGVFFKGDQRINITPRHISHWAATHKAMSQAGLKVPVPLEHTNNPERRRGEVLAMAAKANSRGIPALYAKIKFRDEEAAKLKDSGVSIFVPKDASSGYGHRFVSPVTHVAITDYPVIPDLEPFSTALSLSLLPAEMEMAFDESKHPRGKKGTHEGGKFVTAAKRKATADRAAKSADRLTEIANGTGHWSHHIKAADAHDRAAGLYMKAGSPSNAQFHTAKAMAHRKRMSGESRTESEHLGIDEGHKRTGRAGESDARDHAAAKKMLDHARSLGFTPSKWAGNHDKGNVRLTMHGDDGRAELHVFNGNPGHGDVKYTMQLPFAAGDVNHKIIGHVLKTEGHGGVEMSQRQLHETDAFGLSNGFNPNTSALVMDAASRPGALEGISLSFPPNGPAKATDSGKDDSGSDKSTDKPSPAPQQQSGQQQPPATATQKLSLRDLATQMGIDQSITDEQQLLTMLSNVIMQLKARAQAPMPPQYPPGQMPQVARPAMPPSPMAGQPPAMHPPGQFGPPAMHTGRPPMAMSRKQFRRTVAAIEDVGLSLDDIPEEIVMALSKKQMKKVIKTIKKGKKGKGGVSGDKEYVQKLNDKSHFGTDEDCEGGDYDDTYKVEDNDAFENGEDNDNDGDGTFNGKGSPGKLSQIDSMALSGSVLDAVKSSRTTIIDSLFREGCATAAVRKQMIDQYVNGQGVALSHQYDDGFNATVNLLRTNGKVVNTGKTAVQAAGVVALSNGDLSDANPLVADAERRASGKNNL